MQGTRFDPSWGTKIPHALVPEKVGRKNCILKEQDFERGSFQRYWMQNSELRDRRKLPELQGAPRKHSAASCLSQRHPLMSSHCRPSSLGFHRAPWLSRTRTSFFPGPLATACVLLADLLFSGCSPPSCCPFWGVALVHRFTQLRRHPEADRWQSHLAHGICQGSLHELLPPGPSCLSRQTSPQKPSASDWSPDSDQQSLHCTGRRPSNYSHSSDLPRHPSFH